MEYGEISKLEWSVLGWSELRLIELEWSGWGRMSLGVVGWSELELE